MRLSLRLHFFFSLLILLQIRVNEHKEQGQNLKINIESLNKTRNVLSLIYFNIYNNQENKVSSIIDKFQRELLEIPNFNGMILNRVKSPYSIYKKFYSNNNYQKNWNSIKDLIGFMIIVDTHNEIDEIINYLSIHYSELKNNNSELLTNDFRFYNIRNKTKYKYNYIKNNYQINNGYKTVRINLMYEEYPIEIQIKTIEEYVAHKATHDIIYKNNNFCDEKKKYIISDTLFPLIEVLSHKFIYLNSLSDEKIEECDRDIKLIMDKNMKFYNEYKPIVDSAFEISFIYIFIFRNKKFFNFNNLNDQVNQKLTECNILKVIKYLSNNSEELFNYNFSINPIVYLDYKEFVNISSKIEKTYLLDSISIHGINDIMRNEDLKIIDGLNKCYKKIYFGIYNDELSKLFLGHKTIFSEEDRIKNILSIKNVYGSGIIDNSGNIHMKNHYINDSSYKKFKFCYLPGVFDMYHPGHRIYIEKINELCSILIVGLKSLNYSMRFKNKEPIFNETERKEILLKVKGINDVYITDFDILPDNNTLNELIKYSPNSAIFLGSDWKLCQNLLFQIEIYLNSSIDITPILKNLKFGINCKKPFSSLEQYIYLKKNFPKINLLMIPRENSIHSSSSYRKNILENINEKNHIEISDKI